jgi:hypothetical protein
MTPIWEGAMRTPRSARVPRVWFRRLAETFFPHSHPCSLAVARPCGNGAQRRGYNDIRLMRAESAV